VSADQAAHDVRRLDLFVTEACNLACDYCFAASDGRRRGTIPLLQALHAVDWLMQSRHPRVHITFWGGEPLLRLDLLRQVSAHARDGARQADKTLTLSMPTNATLLTNEALAWIADNRVQIFLSIDGDPRGRPLASGGSSLPLALAGLERAMASSMRPAPSVRMTVTPDNAEQQAETVARFQQLGVRELLLYPAMDRPWSAAALAAFARGQQALATQYINDPRRPLLKAWRPMLRRLQTGSRRQRQGLPSSCAAGSALVALDVRGQFTPCHRFVFYNRDRDTGPTLGSLEHGLDLTATALVAGLDIRDQHAEDGTPCVRCDLFDLCGYGCPAISFAVTGDPARVPAAVCQLMRAQADACRQVYAALKTATLQDQAAQIGAAAWRRYHEG